MRRIELRPIRRQIARVMSGQPLARLQQIARTDLRIDVVQRESRRSAAQRLANLLAHQRRGIVHSSLRNPRQGVESLCARCRSRQRRNLRRHLGRRCNAPARGMMGRGRGCRGPMCRSGWRSRLRRQRHNRRQRQEKGARNQYLHIATQCMRCQGPGAALTSRRIIPPRPREGLPRCV